VHQGEDESARFADLEKKTGEIDKYLAHGDWE